MSILALCLYDTVAVILPAVFVLQLGVSGEEMKIVGQTMKTGFGNFLNKIQRIGPRYGCTVKHFIIRLY